LEGGEFTWRVESFAWRALLGGWRASLGGIHLESGEIHLEECYPYFKFYFQVTLHIADFDCGCLLHFLHLAADTTSNWQVPPPPSTCGCLHHLQLAGASNWLPLFPPTLRVEGAPQSRQTEHLLLLTLKYLAGPLISALRDIAPSQQNYTSEDVALAMVNHLQRCVGCCRLRIEFQTSNARDTSVNHRQSRKWLR